jgi:hypothetical protein
MIQILCSLFIDYYPYMILTLYEVNGGHMRRSASEIIRNLESRVARLEKSAQLLPSSSEMYFETASEIEENVIGYLKENNPGVDWDVSSVEFKKQDWNSGEVEITGRFKTKDYVMVHYDGKKVVSLLEEKQPFTDCHFENYTFGHSNIGRGEIYPHKGLSLTKMIEIEYDDFKGKWVVSSEDRKFNFELDTNFKPEDDASALVREINKRLR